MKVKNAWVTSVRIRVLNGKLSGVVQSFVGKEYDDKTKTELLAVIKKFIRQEGLSDDTAFVIQLEKRPIGGISGIYHTSHFKSISIIP